MTPLRAPDCFSCAESCRNKLSLLLACVHKLKCRNLERLVGASRWARVVVVVRRLDFDLIFGRLARASCERRARELTHTHDTRTMTFTRAHTQRSQSISMQIIT